MRIIDTLAADLRRASERNGSVAATFDPILHIREGNIWTLGMTLSMWCYIFRRDAEDICNRLIPF